MHTLAAQIKQLQWDDHRYYHQCRINQTLHLISAISFLVAYAMLWVDPAAAGIIGWVVGMVTRQSGHIFFEPRGFDTIHNTSYDAKESIKVGFNMRRKAILITVWLSLPLLLWWSPSLFGFIEPAHSMGTYVHDVGLMWLALGAGGLLFRTVHLFFIRSPLCGMAWACKILLDPIHNVQIYWRSPIALMQGQRLDVALVDGAATPTSPQTSHTWRPRL